MVQRRVQDTYEQIEVPLGQNRSSKKDSAQKAGVGLDTKAARGELPERSSAVETRTQAIPQGSASRIAALRPRTAQKMAPREAESWPILPKDRELRGRRGRYRIVNLLKEGERVRLYQGILVINSMPVLIKQYLLPERDFNQKEVRERKEKFEIHAGVNLKNGKGQDFRLISPWDAIAPRNEYCCYLITEPIDNSLTLREYLAKEGPMTSLQVRQVLNQVLQTLCFLHSQRFRISTGEVQQGLAHGNLSLDSLLIAIVDQQSAINEQQFFIYVSDLAFWEHLFLPPTAKTVNPSFPKDLIDLGTVSFYLLSGGTVDSSSVPLDPKIKQQWPTVNDTPLEGFIRRLLGLNGAFKSAEEARQALLSLPLESQIDRADVSAPEEQEVKNSRLLRLLLRAFVLGLLAGLVGALIWLLLTWQRNGAPTIEGLTKDPYGCCIKTVTGIPPGEFTYTAANDATWKYLLAQPSLVSPDKKFEDELKARQMELQLVYKPENSENSAIQALKKGEIDFLLTHDTSKSDDKITKEGLIYNPVAYNGIVVFVPFSDAQRKGSLPEALKGKISFEQLRKLYTGKINNWKELGDAMPDLPVTLYIPAEDEALNIFKNIVFKNHPEEEKEFDRRIDEGKILRKNTQDALRDIFLVKFEEREEKRGSIGFGLLNQVFNQCSVYPLAVGEENQEVQALVLDNSQAIDPTTDLCNKKGSYRPNVQAFKSGEYPFSYRLVVVYDKNNRELVGEKFADILKTDEGQSLIAETGVVPLRFIPNNK